MTDTSGSVGIGAGGAPADVITPAPGAARNRAESAWRMILVFIPLGLASVVNVIALLALHMANGTPPALKIVTVVILFVSVVIHLREEILPSARREVAADHAVVGLLGWGFVPPLIVALLLLAVQIVYGRWTIGGRFDWLTIPASYAVAALWLSLLLKLDRKFATATTMREIIARTKPVFLVIPPVIATFFAVNGSVSALAFWPMILVPSPDNVPHELVFGGIEALNSFLMVFVWCLFMRNWLGTSWFWIGSMVLLHCLAAGYRTHRWDVSDGSWLGAQSGPLITPYFDWPDIIAPILGLLLFLVWYRRRTKEMDSRVRGNDEEHGFRLLRGDDAGSPLSRGNDAGSPLSRGNDTGSPLSRGS